ncbi:MAG: hypothetical protein GY812_03410 [Actinomycetia bacterium]|nr:hypothetical protein [Actinomycetes bacterium]
MADPIVRASAVAELRSWQGSVLSEGVAEFVLRAATVGYPWVSESPDDIGELLIQLLWPNPGAVEVAELERAFVFCAERARRAILRALALRGDDEGVHSVAGLLGLDGPSDLLPVPTNDLLHPLLEAPDVRELVAPLISVAWRRGWAPAAADLLREMARKGRLEPPDAQLITDGLAPLVVSLVDTCDRAASTSDRGPLVRVDRERLAALMPLLAELDSDGATELLRRVLASADPRVAASAIVALARKGELVGEDRVALVAKDPQARALLIDGLTPLGRGFELPESMRSSVAVAEAEAVSWLAGRTQLGSAPDEIEHRGVVPAPPGWGRGLLHVFGFRVRPPHWSSERGWMVLAAGPFDPSAELMPRRAEGFEVCSLYESETGLDLPRHVLAISEAVLAARGEEAA